MRAKTLQDGSFHYVKIHLKSDQGIKNFTGAEAAKMAGENPDYMLQDLFEAIERKDYPSWTAYVQVMSPEDATKYRWNIFDMTKVWPHADYPLRPFGKLTLDENVRCDILSRKYTNVSAATKLLCRYRTGCILPFNYGGGY